MNFTLDQVLKEAGTLTFNPLVAKKALAVIHDPDVNVASLSHVIEADQVMAAYILRLANSAFYGVTRQITTIQQGVATLGVNNVREMIEKTLPPENAPTPPEAKHKIDVFYEARVGSLYRHALGTAIGARLISKQRRLKIDDEAYAAGLLCDVGKVVFKRILAEAGLTETNLRQYSYIGLERAAFGVDHAVLGAEIAKLWELPELFVSVIENHHDPHAAGKNALLAAVVHVADCSMMFLDIGHVNYPLEGGALKTVGIKASELPLLIEKIGEQITKVREIVSLTQAEGI